MNEQICQIIEEFDFLKVYAVMKALGWTWLGSTETPTVGHMVLRATELLNFVAKGDDGERGMGGFIADKVNGCLRLRFVVAEWEYCDEEPEPQPHNDSAIVELL